jgi:hypothetical protein
MFIPKKYGQSKTDQCPFCQKHATSMNSQDIPVCQAHKEEVLDDLKCVCGSILEMLHGKFGVFFKCISCGNMNMRKVLEFNTIKAKTKENNKYINKTTDSKGITTITVRSDDPRYFD